MLAICRGGSLKKIAAFLLPVAAFCIAVHLYLHWETVGQSLSPVSFPRTLKTSEELVREKQSDTSLTKEELAILASAESQTFSRRRDDDALTREPETELEDVGQTSYEDSMQSPNESPGSNDESPSLQDKSLGLGDKSPRIQDKSPRIQDESPRIQDESPRIQDESPRIQDESPRIQDESPRIQDESPRIQDESPRIQDESPRIQDKSPTLQDESPRLKDESPRLQDKSPKRGDTESEDPDEETVKELKALGFEPTSMHEFKSPFIVTPRVYLNSSGSAQASETHSGRKLKIISVVNMPNFMDSKFTNFYNRDFSRCPYSECYYDSTGDLVPNASLVIFHIRPTRTLKMPKTRPPGQIWAMHMWEAPWHFDYPKDYEPWKSVFNWTLYYRTDSDIFAPIETLAWRDRDTLLSDQEYLDIARNKTKTAAWFISNCRDRSLRMKYALELQKHIDIDMYGRCGILKCPKYNAFRHNECNTRLNTTYKFYLSFENAFCRDYATEKVYRSFQDRIHVISVARSAFDYNKYFPKNVLINTADFNSVKELADYLIELGNDLPRYAAMLKEKDKLRILKRKLDWCDACEKLHTNTEEKTIPDIWEWSHKDTCYDPNDIK